jgi:hypothetical protein
VADENIPGRRRQRSTMDRPPKPPGRNWAKALGNKHPELKVEPILGLSGIIKKATGYGAKDEWSTLEWILLDMRLL